MAIGNYQPSFHMFRRNKYRYTRSMVYDYSRVAKIQNRRRNRLRYKKLFTFSLIFSFSTFLMYVISGTLFSKKSSEIVLSPLVAPIQESVENSLQEISSLFSSELKDIIENKLNNVEGEYAVYIKNLNSGEHYGYNENDEFLTASLYKLWTMGTVYEQIEAGKLEKNRVLSASIEDLNKQFNIASEEAELTEGDISRSVDQALEQMITISHNYSALLLTSAVKLSTVREFIEDNKFEHTKVGNSLPTSNALDVARFYEMLYKNQIVNDIYSEEMLSRLKRQRLNDRIPAKLPENIQVAHKTGELYGNKHDAGIVFTPSGDYIIVMMSNTKNPTTAVGVMADLSKDIYDYFVSK